MTKQFNQIVLLAADSVAQLRESDVYRVMNEANEQGMMSEFSAWLTEARPDLAGEITASAEDI